jgi:hypothetical protein
VRCYTVPRVFPHAGMDRIWCISAFVFPHAGIHRPVFVFSYAGIHRPARGDTVPRLYFRMGEYTFRMYPPSGNTRIHVYFPN